MHYRVSFICLKAFDAGPPPLHRHAATSLLLNSPISRLAASTFCCDVAYPVDPASRSAATPASSVSCRAIKRAVTTSAGRALADRSDIAPFSIP